MLPLWLFLSFLAGAAGAWLVRGRLSGSFGQDEAALLKSELQRHQELDAARIRFFGNIAHELRTPLTVVLGQIEAAQVEEDAAAHAHALRVAARNARRIERLAEQALQLTRLDAGTLEPRPRDVDVVPYLESLVLSFEELAERKGVLLEFFGRPRSIPSRFDTDHLTTIVSNLVSNALKYTPAEGRVGVAVEALPGDEGGVLRLVVADTGPGIERERQPRIFDRFARGPEEDRLHPSGAGIGLALVRELARINGGDAEVESEPGRGARFVVTLPHAGPVAEPTGSNLTELEDRLEITEEILYRTTAERSPPAPSSDRPTILVADDSADLREWLGTELQEIGDVIPSADGAVALEVARDSLPDAVVADVRMPGLDGVELCRRLRSDERTSHIPVLLLSVRSTIDRRVEGLEAGADDYLAKPVDPRELRARVAGLMATREALRERFRERVVVRPSEVEAPSVDQEFLDKVVDTIEAELGNGDFSVPDLADAVAMSTSQLTRKLRSLLGQTPAQLIRSLRLHRGADLLAARAGSVGRIAHAVGFADQAHFTRSFKREFGVTPTAYRRSPGSGVRTPTGDAIIDAPSEP